MSLVIVKLDTCGHCQKTMEGAKALLRKEPRHAIFALTLEDLEDVTPFLNTSDMAKLSSVPSAEGFPTIFLIKNKTIVDTVLGEQDANGLKNLLRRVETTVRGKPKQKRVKPVPVGRIQSW